MKIQIFILVLLVLIDISCTKDIKDEKGQNLGIEWIPINSNLTFQMGDNIGGGSENEYPVHTVGLDPYYISKYEISNKQYCQFLNEAQEAGKVMYSATKYQFKGIAKGAGSVEGDTLYLHIDTYHWYYQFEYIDGKFSVKEGLENRPVIMITRSGAEAFARFYGWRLPTEAEWERAAKGPDPGFMYPWGNESPDCERANFGLWDNSIHDKCYQETVDVTSCESGQSVEGCFNMAGNVTEICQDVYRLYSNIKSTQACSPESEPHSYYVVRGGSLYDSPYELRTAYRARLYYGHRHSNIGFRVVK